MTRITIWRWLTRSVPEGQILPPWLTVCQVALFPRRALLWMLNRDCGFNPLMCIWTIHEVKFTDAVFMAMAQPRTGVLYRFERDAGSSIVTVTEVHL